LELNRKKEKKEWMGIEREKLQRCRSDKILSFERQRGALAQFSKL